MFSPGSVDRIMEALVERVERLAELWSDKKRSYLLIFGASDTERFYYPVDTPAFLAHFRTRLAGVSGAEPKPAKNKKNRQQHSVSCGVCHESTSAPVNLDKVFAFATFDKKSFLPGLEDGDASKAKVFPLCGDCYRLLSEGRNIVDGKFLDAKSVYNVRIYTVPELLMGNVNRGYLEQKTKDFLQTGLQNEPFLAERVLEQEDSLTYHFVFWEQNQAQERLLLMVEDVPPSDPAPWEHGVVLGRGFAARPRAGLPSRIVIYRRPVASRAQGDAELAELVRRVVVEQVALMLGRGPEEIDPEE